MFNVPKSVTVFSLLIWSSAILAGCGEIAETGGRFSEPDRNYGPDSNVKVPMSIELTASPPYTTYLATVHWGTDGYLVNLVELWQRKQLADQGVEPYTAAVEDLLDFANSQLSASPSPQEPLDIPGTEGPFVDDTLAAYGLALAYGLTGGVTYAEKSREFIMAWVNTTRSTLNTCPGPGGCQTSLIISRVAPGFVFAANLITPSGVFSAEDDQAFKTWLHDVILPTAPVTGTDNWGDASTFMRVIVADYIGDSVEFYAAINRWKWMADLIACDGHIPAEVVRGDDGILYTQEALTFKLAVALIAERRGLDLWSYGRLKLAADYVAPYVLNPSAWPWAEVIGTQYIHPMWELAYSHWHEDSYEPIIVSRRPHNRWHSAISWATLSNGIPFRDAGGTGPTPECTPIPGPSPTPTNTPTTTPTPTNTPTPTATYTPTDTPTPTATGTATPTPTSTPTPTNTPTPSDTTTPTLTPTATPSP